MADSHVRSNWAGGIDNLAPDDRVPDGYLRDALNVDPTPGGALQLRTGYERAFNGTAIRGMLSLGRKLLVADGPNLIELDTRRGTTRTLRTIAAAGVFIGAVLNRRLFLQTATEQLVYDGETVREWGVPDVLVQPMPQVAAGGALLPGQYKLAVTFTDDSGLEGGTDAPLSFAVAAGEQVTVTLPAPPAGGWVNLYLSAPNGQSLYLQDSRTTAATVTVAAMRDDTRLLTTAYLRRPPLGHVMCEHAGQLAIAVGNVVWVTAPFKSHLVDMRQGYYQYAATVNALLSDGDLFVSVTGDQCYALNDTHGDEPGQRTVLDVPAVTGTAVQLPDGRGAWMTEYGQAVTAKDNRGTSYMELVNRAHFAPPSANQGAAGVVKHGGNELIVTATRGPQSVNGLAAVDIFTGEVRRP